jgi:hypothetical protein
MGGVYAQKSKSIAPKFSYTQILIRLAKQSKAEEGRTMRAIAKASAVIEFTFPHRRQRLR